MHVCIFIHTLMAIIFKDPVNQSKGKEKDALKCLKNASKVGGGMLLRKNPI